MKAPSQRRVRRIKWRVNDPALAKSLVTNGGKLVADYGGFQLIQADDTASTNSDSNRIEREDEFDAIKLNAGQLDTRPSLPRNANEVKSGRDGFAPARRT